MGKLKFLAACCVFSALSGCGSLNPLTRPEFVEGITKGVPFSMTDTYTSKKKFEQVVSVLSRKTDECLNFDMQTTRTEGSIRTMNIKDEFRTTFKVVSPSRAELTTQFTSKGITYLQKIPEGGFYHRAIDIERQPDSTTKLSYYGPNFESAKKDWEAIKQWSDGKMVPCR